MTFLHACLANPCLTFAAVVALLAPLADYLSRKEPKRCPSPKKPPRT